MKKVAMMLSCALLSTGAWAQVDSSVIYLSRTDNLQDVRTHFVIDPREGRAWISLSASRAFDEIPYRRDIQVNGLRLDAARQQVVLNVNGQEVTCAHARERGVGFFKSLTAVPTGQCQIKSELATLPSENESFVQRAPVLMLHLQTQSS